MPHFKHKKTGALIEVTESFAGQVIRQQGHYEEYKPEAPKKVEAKVSKKKAKTTKKAY